MFLSQYGFELARYHVRWPAMRLSVTTCIRLTLCEWLWIDFVLTVMGRGGKGEKKRGEGHLQVEGLRVADGDLGESEGEMVFLVPPGTACCG